MNRLISFILVLVGLCAVENLSAQGTAFSYQGQLNDGGAPANGSYDLRFAVYNAETGGNRVSAWLTNSAVAVSNGLFVTTLDFGAGLFTGTNYWLDIAVRNTNTAPFTALVPRQPILPVPYSIFANGASNLLGSVTAGQVTGVLPANQVSGTSPNQVNFNNLANSFSGTFIGDGSSLSNLNGSQITSGTVTDARLTTNVALLDHSQTYTGNNQFNGANNFTNRANSFTGSFFGNGLVGWVAVSGTTQQAERDHGYMLTSSGLTTVTLPPNTGLTNGDIVRVSGAGPGGWTVAENSGQSIFGNFATYRYCHLVKLGSLSALPGDAYGIAATSDGSRMYAVGNFYGLYVSTDYGNSWHQDGPTSVYMTGVACSADGMTVYRASGSYVYKSTDGGVTWGGAVAAGSSVACSADGSQYFAGQFACSGNGTYRAEWTSSSISYYNGGAWISIPKPAGTLNCVAVSSDCSRLVAGIDSGLLYASANYGATWTALTRTNQYWEGVWMSADGTRIAATSKTVGVSSGALYSTEIKPLPNTVSTNSTIGGSQGDAVELQYIGNGQFMPVSSTGTIWAN